MASADAMAPGNLVTMGTTVFADVKGTAIANVEGTTVANVEGTAIAILPLF
jgi:hypothetical protein